MPDRHQLFGERALRIEFGVGLRDDELAFLDRRQVVNLVGDLAVLDLAVRRLQEAVVVGARVHGQRVDQADVRAFRGLDRADATIVRRVHVAHLEAGTLASQAAGAQGRYAALVRNLGQRVVLVHELRQLAGAEKLLDCSSHRLGVDHFLRHQAFGLGQRQPLLDRALDAHQADAEGILGHLADAADAPVAQMVDVVDRAAAVADVDQYLEHVDHVFPAQRAGAFALARPAADPAVELHPADGGQVVAFRIEEQVLEQVLGRVLGRRLTRAHHAVDLHQRFEAGGRRVDTQRTGNVRTLIQVIHVQRLDVFDTLLDQQLDLLGREFVVCGRQQFAGLLVDHVVREDLALEIFGGTTSVSTPAFSSSRM